MYQILLGSCDIEEVLRSIVIVCIELETDGINGGVGMEFMK